MIEWRTNARREDTQVSKRRTWNSLCGHYKVEESQITYGEGKDRKGVDTGYPRVFRAMQRNDWGWLILSYHRKKKTAQDACQARADGRIIEKKKRTKRVLHEEDFDE
jgi:hypothetical protein